VIPSEYDGSPAQVANVIQNIGKTGRIGELVSTDLTSSMVYAPLMNHNNVTGAPLDYGELARDLNGLRTKYDQQGVTLHITGFSMIVGNMILGIKKIMGFFGISAVIAGLILFWFTRSLRCTMLVIVCTLVAVIWQLGLLPLLGYSLDPYSVLVPFLIFAIGMSHGAQKMNGVMQDIGRGAHKLVAARYTFRRLFMAGFTALICDAVGFAVLCIIDIQEIRELAIIAGCGVAVLIFTNLILLPVLLSYVGVGKKAALRSLRAEQAKTRQDVWTFLTKFAQRRWAAPVIGVALVLGIGGAVIGRGAQIGNIGDGAPELRYNSIYNRDVRYIQQHYSVSSDALVLLVDSKPYTCTDYDELSVLDRLDWRLDQLPEVQSSMSLAAVMVNMTQTMTDDSPKWHALVARQALINDFVGSVPLGYDNLNCSFVPLTISMNDLSDRSLTRVITSVNEFLANPANQSPNFTIQLAGGNGGVAAATNRVIREANTNMLIWIYAAVALLCFITFKSWRAVLCAILPLVLTSMLCKALMVFMGIGVTVATLPVVALGVGIGVDYALYVMGVMMAFLRMGHDLEASYHRSLQFTGRIVMLTGLTLAIGVGSWAFAPLKFQAEMGLLLAFMFLWNMVGTLVLLPALACFLLPVKNVGGPMQSASEGTGERPRDYTSTAGIRRHDEEKASLNSKTKVNAGKRLYLRI
jgi:predicted RND superfamily exporter protein